MGLYSNFPRQVSPRSRRRGMQDWRDHFDRIGKGAILANLTSRTLHYWGADGT